MESWLPYFVIIASVAIVLQAAMLIAMFFALRESLQRITKITVAPRSAAQVNIPALKNL